MQIYNFRRFDLIFSLYEMKKYSRITTQSLKEMKTNGDKISMLTAYDYTTAKIIDQSQIDVILVGDSASNVIAGHETTLPITLDEMIYHAKCVIRATKEPLLLLIYHLVHIKVIQKKH